MITSHLVIETMPKTNYATVYDWLNAPNRPSTPFLETSFSIESLNILFEFLATFANELSHDFYRTKFFHALTHKTFSLENANITTTHNEVLEFAGDSILNCFFTLKLISMFPDMSEGDLSKLRTSLVNENSFYELGLCLSLDKNLFIGKGELLALGNKKQSLVANAFEALMGAFFLETHSFEALSALVEATLKLYEQKNLKKFIDNKAHLYFDSKSLLQELTIKEYKCLPVYRACEVGQEFLVELLISGEVVGKMSGASKKKIEKELARKALVEHFKITRA